MNRFRRDALRFVFEADKGAGSGSGTGDGTGSKTGEQNNDENKPNDGGQKPNDDANKNGGDSDKKFTQADLDKVVKDRLAAEKTRQDRANQEKQGEFEKLYNELKPIHETAAQELETLKTQNETYSKLLEGNIQNTIKDWPKEVKDLYPSTASVEDRLAWVEKSSGLAKRLTTQKPPVGGEHGSQGDGTSLRKVEEAQTNRYVRPVIPGVKL